MYFGGVGGTATVSASKIILPQAILLLLLRLLLMLGVVRVADCCGSIVVVVVQYCRAMFFILPLLVIKVIGAEKSCIFIYHDVMNK